MPGLPRRFHGNLELVEGGLAIVLAEFDFDRMGCAVFVPLNPVNSLLTHASFGARITASVARQRDAPGKAFLSLEGEVECHLPPHLV